MNILGLLLKEPQPGKVKTRLAAEGLGQDFVLDLYQAFIDDTIDLIQKIPVEQKWVFIAPGASEEFIRQIHNKGFEVFIQRGAHFGERMAHFFQTAFEQGGTRAVLIGSDSPSLPPAYLNQAFSQLQTKKFVIGPSVDGGYYLVGMSQFIPQVFHNIQWSSEQVLVQSLEKIEEQGLIKKSALLPVWYDIDHLRDLEYLYFHLSTLDKGPSGCFPKKTWQIIKTRPWPCYSKNRSFPVF